MPFTQANFQNELGQALAASNERLMFDKASVSGLVAGGLATTWRLTGVPTQGAIPGAAAICNKATTGSFPFANEAGGLQNYVAWAYYAAGNAGQSFELRDRLAHMGGLSGTVTTAQAANIDLGTLGISAARRGAADYSEVLWFLEWYTTTGGTGVNATVNVTYDDASTGNIVIAIPASTAASRAIQILPGVAGRNIKGVNNVTLSATTGTAGSFGVTASTALTSFENDVAGKGKDHSWSLLGIPRVIDDSCLFGVLPQASTTTGTLRGQFKLAKV